jgi:hypothetical protein
LSLTRTSHRKTATVKAALTAAGTAVATAAVTAAALATAGPAAGSLSGLGSAGAQAQVAHVATVTHDAGHSTGAVTPTPAITGAHLTIVIRSGTPARLTAARSAAAASAARAARQTARKMLGHFGWGARQFSPLVNLWNRESGWNKYAQNPSSGAYGIPQAVPGSKMASAGKNWRTNATTQIRWGLRYIKGRYGYPRRAWQHELAYGWY